MSDYRHARMQDQSGGKSSCALQTDHRLLVQHCVAYLAEAPKSTRSYNAYKRASLTDYRHGQRLMARLRQWRPQRHSQVFHSKSGMLQLN
jgi:hypothetical protein